MSQLKVNAISDAAGANGNAITLATDGTCTAKVTNSLSNRNLIINGDMTCYQRNAATTTHNSYAADRFKYSVANCDENPTLERVALTSSDTGPWEKGFRFANQFTNGNQTSGAVAGAYIRLMQRIEAQNIAQSGWDYKSASSKITLSFWVKSSVAQNFYGYIYTPDGTAQQYPFETGSLSANTWTKITKTIPGNSNITVNSDNGEGLRITWVPFYGTNYTGTPTLNTWAAYSSSASTPASTTTWFTTNDATLAITGIQLEVSDHATEFEHRTYSDELARCQRYYYLHAEGNENIATGCMYSSTLFAFSVQFPQTMRATPTMEYVSGTDYYLIYRHGTTGDDRYTDMAATRGSTKSIAVDSSTGTSGTAGYAGILACGNAAAKIAFTAEL